jgi:hypothetical protein
MNCFKQLARSSAALAVAGLMVMPALAVVGPDPLDIDLSYSVTTGLDPQANPQNIYDIITFNAYGNGGGSWWPASVPLSGGSIDDPFKKSSANPPTAGLLLGLVDNLAGDVGSQTHVVLMLDTAGAAAAKGVAWDTTFSGTDETALITNLRFAMENDRNLLDEAGQAQWDASLNAVGTFADTNRSLWFAMAAPLPGQTTTSNFTVMAWSDGQELGQGIASVTQAVPEPGSAALLLLGLAGVAGWARRRAAAA